MNPIVNEAIAERKNGRTGAKRTDLLQKLPPTSSTNGPEIIQCVIKYFEVKQTIGKIWKEGNERGDEKVKAWMKDQRTERFSIDLFVYFRF